MNISDYSLRTKAIHLTFCILILCFDPNDAASRKPLSAKHGMVASVSEIASRIGVETMQKGGNAVDAACAVAFALAVVWPEAGNLGGGGFMLIRKADGTMEAIDYRERAPLAATRDMYLDPNGNVIEEASSYGHKAVAVPGTVAGLALAMKRHGKLRWQDAIEPARKLAEKGFILSPYVVQRMRPHEETLSRDPETSRVFLRNKKIYEVGERLIQPDLAKTLARLRTHGPREFYEGETARLIVSDMKQNGGLITSKDLREYEPTIRKPLHGTYRGYEIITMSPPSSGGVALIQMLNMLETFDLASKGHYSSDYFHTLVEVMKRAFADRAAFLADPDFVTVPVEKLISKEYALDAVKTIDPGKATPANQIQSAKISKAEPQNTTHFSIVDAEGTIVSNTYTLNDSFGSGVTVPGAGFLLNNEMDDFTSKPGVPNLFGLLQSEANAIVPRKRPLSSMTPVIVLKGDQPYFAIGSAGGSTIINTVLRIIVSIIDFRMDLQQAIDEPRFHHQWMPDEIYFEPFGINKDTRNALEGRGHKFAPKYFFSDTDYMGDAQGILIDPLTGIRFGASDPRRGGVPVGY